MKRASDLSEYVECGASLRLSRETLLCVMLKLLLDRLNKLLTSGGIQVSPGTLKCPGPVELWRVHYFFKVSYASSARSEKM